MLYYVAQQTKLNRGGGGGGEGVQLAVSCVARCNVNYDTISVVATNEKFQKVSKVKSENLVVPTVMYYTTVHKYWSVLTRVA